MTEFATMLAHATASRDARIRAVTAAFAASPAIITIDRTGHRTLVIMSGETADLVDGPIRVTYLEPDGPRSHSTRPTAEACIAEVATYAHEARPATEDEVIEWTSSAEFSEGVERVLEVQRWNAEHARRAP